MPNLVDVLLRTHASWPPPRAPWPSPTRWYMEYDGVMRWVLARRLGCYIETGDTPPQPSAGIHAPWPQFCEPRPVQLAASHLVRAEAAVSCRGRGRSAVQNDRILRNHRATQSPMACVRWMGHGT
jgi:hypothetical protein